MAGLRSFIAVILLAAAIPLPALTSAEPRPQDMIGGARAYETWTVLGYVCGDNNLETDVLNDLEEMERIETVPGVNIVVQIDRSDQYDIRDGDWRDTRRYLVQYHPASGIGSLRLDEPPLGELDMDDPENLRTFLEWGLEGYPADHYMLMFGGHASGPAKGLMKDGSSSLGGSREMESSDMGEAVRAAVDLTLGHPLDVVSFDVCWMGMAETAFELMDRSDYLIGSFDEIPAAGWPYDKVLGLIVNSTAPMAERLASVIDGFMDNYDIDNAQSYASLCAIDLAAFKESFTGPWKELSEEMFYSAYSNRNLYDLLSSSVDTPRSKDSGADDRYIDVYQFASLLSKDTRTPTRVRAAAEALLGTEEQVLVHSKGGVIHPRSSRLFGIYFPTEWSEPLYPDVAMGGLTAWDDMIAVSVRDLDLRPDRLNWTANPPPSVKFLLRTSDTTYISKVQVEVVSGTVRENISLIGQGGLYSAVHDVGGVSELYYRYRAFSTWGGYIEYPPDGYAYVRFAPEVSPPEVWHRSPALIESTSLNGGLVFYLRDATGLDKVSEEGRPRLEYRERGDPSWYSIPLEEGAYERFLGWTLYSGNPLDMTPGSVVEYHIICRDVNGNSLRYPEAGELTSVMGAGRRFYLDAQRSDLSAFGSLLAEFQGLGMSLDQRTDGDLQGLTDHKGYILISPSAPLSSTDAGRILSFHEDGGEVLLVLDPRNASQSANVAPLLSLLSIGPTADGSVNGYYPASTSSEMGAPLPSIAGSSTGSFRLNSSMHAVYYTRPPLAAMYTMWSQKGRCVVSIPSLLDDDALINVQNRQLADRAITYLSMNMAPMLSVEVDPEGVIVPGTTVTFNLSGTLDRDGTVQTYSLSISDGTHYEGSSPLFEHEFMSAGVYSIELGALDAEGEGSSMMLSERVNRAPTPEFGISPIDVHADDQVTFDYKGRDPDGDVLTVKWSFGDGNAVTGTLVKHSYRQRGNYEVVMTVVDAWGLVTERTFDLKVMNSAPVAGIDKDSITVNGGNANFSGELKITLIVEEGDVISASGSPTYDLDRYDSLNYSWSMGDGSTLYGKEIVHSYLVSGLFRANLTVTDGAGGVDHAELSVSVSNHPPYATFDARTSKHGVVRFDASGSMDDEWDRPGMSFIWDFGDGNSLTTHDPTVSHDYAFGGDHKVRLTVKDLDGASDSYSMTVRSTGLTLTEVISLIAVSVLLIAVAVVLIVLHLRRRMVQEESSLTGLIMKDKGERPDAVRRRDFRQAPGPKKGEPRMKGFARPERAPKGPLKPEG